MALILTILLVLAVAAREAAAAAVQEISQEITRNREKGYTAQKISIRSKHEKPTGSSGIQSSSSDHSMPPRSGKKDSISLEKNPTLSASPLFSSPPAPGPSSSGRERPYRSIPSKSSKGTRSQESSPDHLIPRNKTTPHSLTVPETTSPTSSFILTPTSATHSENLITMSASSEQEEQSDPNNKTTGDRPALVTYITDAIPDPNQYKNSHFDGDNVTEWLDFVERVYRRKRINHDELIQEIMYWTCNIQTEKRVRATIAECETWSEARRALLNAFRMSDADQKSEPAERLSDLERGRMVSKPTEIANYVLDHKVLVHEVLNHEDRNVKPDLRTTRFTAGFLKRINAEVCDSALRRHTSCTWETRSRLKYGEAVDAITKWAAMRQTLLDANDEVNRQHTLEPPVRRQSPVPEVTDQPIPRKQVSILRRPTEAFKAVDEGAVDELRSQFQQLQLANLNAAQEMNNFRQEMLSIMRSQYPNPSVDHTSINAFTVPDRQGGYRGGRNQRQDQRDGMRCYFCGDEGHTTSRCEALETFDQHGVLHWNPNEKAYFLGPSSGDPALNWIQVPSKLTSEARLKNVGVMQLIFKWLRFDAKVPLEFRRKVYACAKTRHDLPHDEEDLQALRTGATSKQVQEGRVSLVQLQDPVDQDNEPVSYVFSEPEPVVDDDWDEIIFAGHPEPLEVNALRADGTEPPMPKRARDDDNEERDLPMSDQPNPHKAVKEKSLQTSRDHMSSKVAQHLDRRFDVTFWDVLRMVPDFEECLVNSIKNRKQEIGLPTYDTLRINVLPKPPQGFDTGPSISALNAQEAPAVMLSQAPRSQGFVFPLFRLTVRVGSGGGEEEISAVVDSGAQTSVISRGYANRNRLPMEETKMSYQLFDKGESGKRYFDGLISGSRIWLADRCMTMPGLYVAPDKQAGHPLLLGQDFIEYTKMSTYQSDGWHMAAMTFGNTRIHVPLREMTILKEGTHAATIASVARSEKARRLLQGSQQPATPKTSPNRHL